MVGGAVVHLTCPVLSHLPVCSHVCTRPALCGPHASRVAWPALTPACKPALALALAPAPEQPARPRLGAGCVRSDFPYPAVRARAFPACPTACSPSRLSLLSGAARPVSLAQTMMIPDVRTAVCTAHPNSRPQPPATAARSIAALLMRAPAKSGASDVATGAANPFEIARDSRVGTGCRFFSRFRVHPASSGPSERDLKTPEIGYQTCIIKSGTV